MYCLQYLDVIKSFLRGSHSFFNSTESLSNTSVGITWNDTGRSCKTVKIESLTETVNNKTKDIIYEPIRIPYLNKDFNRKKRIALKAAFKHMWSLSMMELNIVVSSVTVRQLQKPPSPTYEVYSGWSKV